MTVRTQGIEDLVLKYNREIKENDLAATRTHWLDYEAAKAHWLLHEAGLESALPGRTASYQITEAQGRLISDHYNNRIRYERRQNEQGHE